MIKVGVAITTFNNEADIIDCLKDLEKTQRKAFEVEIIVVDNHSFDNTTRLVREQFPKIKLYSLSENYGLAKANNKAIKELLQKKSDFIFLVNPDTIISPNLIGDLLKFMGNDQNIGVCGPKIYFAKNFEYHKNRYKEAQLGKVFWYAGGSIDWKNVLPSHLGVDEVDTGQYETVVETDFVSGCAMFVRKEVFEKIGFLDEKLAMYLEDLDFCLRAKTSGFRVIYAPVKGVWHKNAQSTGVGSFTQDYYMTRNRLVFAMRYAGMRAKIAVLKESLKLIWAGRAGQKTGIIDFYLRKFNIISQK